MSARRSLKTGRAAGWLTVALPLVGGRITDYDPTDEHVYMQQAGLSYRQILAALTTAPAARFGVAARSGRLAVGFDADVVVLEGDPATDIRALARVRTTMRAGRVIAG